MEKKNEKYGKKKDLRFVKKKRKNFVELEIVTRDL